ncbi:leucyl/phenylalanyl-tRNA--protein transferase [Nibricoccus aquaticus]|nr:leucyl/phenylalanyl-tRNA--protein transferase [Nibricoccus aquaticus]
MRLTFPSLREIAAGPEEIVWTDATALTVENLRAAYRTGIFPWPSLPGELIPWCSPDPRAVLVFDELTPGRTLEKTVRRGGLTFTIDRAFSSVIAACAAAPRPGQDGTWIAPAIIAAYTALHHAGVAHSVEVWRDKKLIGGLYGVDAGGVFCGESMFHHEPNASKLAIIHLTQHLASRGSSWMDIQQLTPHMQRLGAREVPRERYLAALERELTTARALF